jgi:WD40 repeat protein
MLGVILLHRFDDGRAVGELRGHRSQITALAAVPRSSTLISADDAGRVLFWNLPARSGHSPAGWPGSTGVGALAVSADGALVAAGDDDGVLSIIDINARIFRRRFPIAEHEIETVAWIDTQAVVVGTTTGQVLVVNAETGEIEKQWKISAADIVLVGVSPGGTVFAIDGAGKLVQWNGFATSEVQLAREIAGAAYDPVHDVIAASGIPGAIQLYARGDGAPVAESLLGHALLVPHAVFSRDGRHLLSGSFDDSVMAWDLEQVHPMVVARYRFRTEPVPRILSDGYAAVFVANGRGIERWRLARSGPVQATLLHHEWMRLFTVSADGSSIGSTSRGSKESIAEIWIHRFAPDGKWKKRKLGEAFRVIRRLSTSGNGAFVAIADEDHRVRVWRTRDGRHWEIPPDPIRPDAGRFITSLVFSDDERWLGVGDQDGGLRLFATDTGILVAEQSPAHAGFVFSIAFDDRRIASGAGGSDRNIILQDVPSLTNTRRLRGLHSGPIGVLAFDSDATLLVSAAADRMVMLWDARTLQPIGAPLAAHESIPHDVRLAAGAQMMLTSDDDAVLVWDISAASWKKIACTQANRELTESEWSERVPDEDYRVACGPAMKSDAQ